MNPHISVPRQHAGSSTFGSTPATRGVECTDATLLQKVVQIPPDGLRDGCLGDDLIVDRPQESFQVHILSCENVSCASGSMLHRICRMLHDPFANSIAALDPSFTYLLSFFLILTAFAWGLAYTPSFGAILRLTILFVFVHFIGSSLLISTIGYFIIGKLFGPDGAAASLAGLRGSRGRRRGAAQGLFMQPGEKEQLEFGYCFDVSNRAFFPLYLHLYVVQFLLLPLLTRSPSNFLATFLGNSLYLSALIYYTYITFLGYNALPFLHNTELLLVPIVIFAILWLISLIAGWGIVMQGRSVEGLLLGV
ncbi:hypothetical protein N7452_007834 [Penicillium brevicompactum]|uniref:Integral membrane protein n=1 Tax=Penicillium brevicompactum TaxID=5074 RepID=A0A9W9QII3_PENBR|nr:hypothetical protein N7452_007834 [Penicillium brevicompactum]